MSLPRLKDVPRRSDGQVMCATAFIAFRVRKESEIYIYSQVHTYRRSLEGYHSQSILVNFTCNLTASGGCLTIQEAQPLTIDNLAYMSVYTGFIKNLRSHTILERQSKETRNGSESRRHRVSITGERPKKSPVSQTNQKV